MYLNKQNKNFVIWFFEVCFFSIKSDSMVFEDLKLKGLHPLYATETKVKMSFCANDKNKVFRGSSD